MSMKLTLALALVLCWGCDYGLEHGEHPGWTESNLEGGGPEAPAASTRVNGPSPRWPPPGSRSTGDRGTDYSATGAANPVEAGGQCIYLRQGRVVVLPCVMSQGSGGRRHGDPDPWTPDSKQPDAPPLYEPY